MVCQQTRAAACRRISMSQRLLPIGSNKNGTHAHTSFRMDTLWLLLINFGVPSLSDIRQASTHQTVDLQTGDVCITLSAFVRHGTIHPAALCIRNQHPACNRTHAPLHLVYVILDFLCRLEQGPEQASALKAGQGPERRTRQHAAGIGGSNTCLHSRA